MSTGGTNAGIENSDTSSTGHSTGANHSDSSTTAGSSSDGNVQSSSSTNTSGYSNTSGSSTSKQTGISTTTANVDEDTVSAEKAAAAQAGANATDPTKTQGLVDSIFSAARNAFAGTEAQQGQAGLYGSVTLQNLAADSQQKATADSTAAVLNYQSDQQKIQSSLLDSILQATKGSTTSTSGSGTTQTGQSTNSASSSSTLSDVISHFINGNSSTTVTNGDNVSNTNSSSGTTSEKASIGISIVCTELLRQKKISKDLWKIGMRDLGSIPLDGQAAYRYWASPLASYLRKHPTSLRSKVLEHLFTSRLLWVQAGKPLFAYGSLLQLIAKILCYIVAYTVIIPQKKRSEAAEHV